MEDILSLYAEDYNSRVPVVCIDEKSKELHQQIKDPLPLEAGKGIREDYQCKHAGVANIFLAFEPKAGIQYAKVSEKKNGREFSDFLKLLVDKYGVFPFSVIDLLHCGNTLAFLKRQTMNSFKTEFCGLKLLNLVLQARRLRSKSEMLPVRDKLGYKTEMICQK